MPNRKLILMLRLINISSHERTKKEGRRRKKEIRRMRIEKDG
jgi:hypothetical protein